MAYRVPPLGAHYSRPAPSSHARTVQAQVPPVPAYGARVPVATPNTQNTVASTAHVGQAVITYSGHVVPGQRKN